jgi:uncharacterized protein
MNMADRKRTPEIKAFKLDKIKITDTYSNNALKKELEYLNALEPDKLLAGFYERQGKKGKAERYPGWESTEIQGHTLGHYLTALAQAYENTGSEEIKDKLAYLVSELKNCQTEDGFLFASSEELFDRVENRKPAWVPWYTMHKILAGIISVYNTTESKEAFETASALGDWIYKRTSAWSEELQQRVLSVEYGGMNDALYELYKVTGKAEHLAAAHSFDEIPLFEAMAEGRDILNNKHANTTIPKIIGALNRYMVLGEGEEFYLKAAQSFWDMVTEHHTYITGGNSEWEHFGLPDILDKERTNCNCETCNSYNMLKLSKLLFQATGERKYADFYERTHINSILSSQNPETGMTTYFQPMATGFFKVYGTPFDKFWCCTGTGMENFTKLNDGIYYYKENSLYINRFVNSEISWEEKGIRLIQCANLPESNEVNIKIVSTGEENNRFALKIRIPEWVRGEIRGSVNGTPFFTSQENKYIVLEEAWKSEDTISLEFPIAVRAVSLPDNPNVYAFAYGPVVLSAALGKAEMKIRQTGVAVDIPLKEFEIKDYIVIKGDLKEWLDNLTENLLKEDGKMVFKLKGTDEDDKLIFTPHYKQYEERYGIYWKLYGENSSEMAAQINAEKEKERFEQAVVDRVPVSNDQYELSHNIESEFTHNGERLGFVGRVIKAKGWLSYRMEVDPEAVNILAAGFHKWDSGRTVLITIDGELLVKYVIGNEEEERLVRKSFKIPENLIAGKKQVTVRLQAEKDNEEFSIWDYLIIHREV